MGVLLLLIGLGVLGFGVMQHLKGKRILSAPFKKTGELAQNPTSPDPKGAISTEGAMVVGQPLLSPCSQTPCIAYEVEVTRKWEKEEQTQDGTKKSTGSEKVDTVKQGMTIQVDDGTGAVNVDLSQASVSDFDTAKKNFEKKVSIGAFVPGELEFGQMRMQTPRLPGGDRTTAFEAVEKIVPLGGNLFVLGKIDAGGISKPSWRSMMFSSKGRDGLLASTAKKAKIGFIAGGVVTVLAIPVMIFAPASSGGSGCGSKLAGEVARCSTNLSSAKGENYKWTVAEAGAYDIRVIPPPGKKYPLFAEVKVTDGTGAAVAAQSAASPGDTIVVGHDFQPGTYTITVKDIAGEKVKGGWDFALEIVKGAGAAKLPPTAADEPTAAPPAGEPSAAAAPADPPAEPPAEAAPPPPPPAKNAKAPGKKSGAKKKKN